MARILISLLLIILPIAAYSQQLPLSRPVLDNNGDPIVTGVDYEIDAVPFRGPIARRVPPRTVGLSSAPNHTCPLDVVIQKQGIKALPVKFSSLDSKDNETVNTFLDTNIVFSASTVCLTSTVWTIQSGTVNGTITFFVEIGGVAGTPESRFNIQQGKDVDIGGYVINFCPRVCRGCERPAACGNIGVIVDDDGRTRLGVTSGEGLEVRFVKTASNN